MQTQRWIASLLVALLVWPAVLSAQQAQPAAPLPATQSLRVISLSGDAVNDLEKRLMTPLVVQVLDQNARPIEGAQVTFRFPLQGPTAEFADRQTSQTVRTNADGQAVANNWIANRQTGTFKVQVTAISGSEIGETTVTMTNASRILPETAKRHKSFWSSKWTKIGIIAGAAGAVAAIVLVTRGDSSTTVTASPGSPTIGGPR